MSSNEIQPECLPCSFNEQKTWKGAYLRLMSFRTRLVGHINRLKRQADSIEAKGAAIQHVRNKEWYERYRWFITSDGLLAIGGRDASSNSAIIRKHLEEQDLVFHAEIHGSPFFILKNSHSLDNIDRSLLEVGQATVSFSRAWKDGLYGSDAYWVTQPSKKRSTNWTVSS